MQKELKSSFQEAEANTPAEAQKISEPKIPEQFVEPPKPKVIPEIKVPTPKESPRTTPKIKNSPKPPPRNQGNDEKQESQEDVKPPPRERGLPKEVVNEIKPKIEADVEPEEKVEKPERVAPEPPNMEIPDDPLETGYK